MLSTRLSTPPPPRHPMAWARLRPLLWAVSWTLSIHQPAHRRRRHPMAWTSVLEVNRFEIPAQASQASQAYQVLLADLLTFETTAAEVAVWLAEALTAVLAVQRKTVVQIVQDAWPGRFAPHTVIDFARAGDGEPMFSLQGGAQLRRRKVAMMMAPVPSAPAGWKAAVAQCSQRSRCRDQLWPAATLRAWP